MTESGPRYSPVWPWKPVHADYTPSLVRTSTIVSNVPRVRRAQALVEFALVLPVMLLMLLGMIDLGRAFVFGVATQEGARQAARLAASANYDVFVDDSSVFGRLVASSAPALVGCSATPPTPPNTTTTQSCNGGTWTFSVCVNDGTNPCNTIAGARTARTLAGAKVTVTAAGSVALVPGLQTGAFGLVLPTITVQGQTAMVVL